MARINGEDRSIVNKTKRLTMGQKMAILNTLLNLITIGLILWKL